MKTFKRLIFVISLSLLGFAVLAFVLENQQLSSLIFLGWVLPGLPVSVLIVVSFFSGCFLGSLFRFGMKFGGRKKGVEMKT